ncbi:unnamed protein product [Mycena citricolor]|uniref:Uncharacterized protein n=1 Tax=Mycena citricolor TaxID=2018698 RepID=A0AAD2JVZ0_9AGAR|nr:unnamed protein product [Mycena citricolor]
MNSKLTSGAESMQVAWLVCKNIVTISSHVQRQALSILVLLAKHLYKSASSDVKSVVIPAMQHLNYSEPSSSRHGLASPPMGHLTSSANSLLSQPAPPTLRDILGAYKLNGDGDRDMLIAMLNAKTAEDQRISALAALHRTMLDVYHLPSHSSHRHDYPMFSHPSPPPLEVRSSRPAYQHVTPYPRPSYRASSPNSDHRRKRARASRSPPPSVADHRHPMRRPEQDEFPPSPSSSSDSADYSPRSRGSMTITSLLSTSTNADGSADERA